MSKVGVCEVFDLVVSKESGYYKNQINNKLFSAVFICCLVLYDWSCLYGYSEPLTGV